MVYDSASPRAIIATLSDLVEQAAGQGDSAAIAILDEASRELAGTIGAVYPKLGTTAVPLIITGGTILHGIYLRNAFDRACEAQGLIFTGVHYISEPAEGALQWARKVLLDGS
jgi:N-acetylglucosamine kinase-like BadF-type ATPase